MLKINLETNIDNLAFLDYMQQQCNENGGNSKTKLDFEILQPAPEEKDE